ncbi:hypothetical protein [Staphylococcus phage PT94]
MKSPNCDVCGGEVILNQDNEHECVYCGTTTDENGDVLYEIQGM